MAISKIILNGVTQIDLTTDTVAAGNLIAPNTAHGANGERIIGTANGGSTPSGPTYETYFDSSVNGTHFYISDLNSLAFAADKTWRVTWDDTEYICATVYGEPWGLYYIGDVNLADGGSGSADGEPFLLFNYAGNFEGYAKTSGTHTLKLEKQTSSGGGSTPSATQHTIEFEFTDSTSTTLTGYWDAAFITSTITATTPAEYGSKTVESVSLDGVVWYTRPSHGTFETVWEGTSTPRTDGGEYFWITDMSAVNIANGSTWRITIDGTAYVCTAKQATIDYLGEWTVLGNPVYAGGIDDGSDIPFCFYNYNGQAFCGDINLTVKEYSIKFERQVSA